MKKYQICTKCMFFKQKTNRKSLKIKNGYCLYPDITKNDIDYEKCDYYIPNTN